MKKYLIILAIIAFVQTVVGQQGVSQTDAAANPKTCYDEYYDAFITRGALEVPDGEQNVAFSIRKGTSCTCGLGKVTIKDGKIIPDMMVKKADGTYEPAKKKLHPRMIKGEVESQHMYYVYKGMSQTLMTDDDFIADLFFIDYLKRKVVPNAVAPSPNDLPGVQIELQGKEKDIVSKAYEGLQFETGKAQIKPSSFPHLNLLADMLKEKKDYKLNIHGYTDNVGAAETNLTLSKNRAEAVKNYLIKQGLDATRISSEGFGMENPIGDNRTEAGRAQNRRVEFIVVQ